jgi:DNA-binding CsgD family transcriptional regulator
VTETAHLVGRDAEIAFLEHALDDALAGCARFVAGRSAARQAPSSAARWFSAALRVLPNGGDPAERAELLTGLASARAATGQLQASRAALLETLALIPDDEPLRRVALISACANVEQLLGHNREARQRLHAALGDLSETVSREGAALMIAIAADSTIDGRHDDMLGWAASALETATILGDEVLMATAAAIATVACSWGAVDEAEGYRSRAVTLVDALPDEALAQSPQTLGWLSSAELFLNRFEEGIGHGRRGLALARSSGRADVIPRLIQALGVQLALTGRLAEATELLDDSVNAGRLTDNAWSLGWSLGSRSYAAVMEGDVETAIETGREAVALTRDSHGSVVRARASAALGAAFLLRDQPEAALELLTDGDVTAVPDMPRMWQAFDLEALTRCCLALGRMQDAERAAERARELATEVAIPLSVALADRAAAAVALAVGDALVAAELARTSAETAARAGARVEAALSLTTLGRSLAAIGADDKAADELETAAGILEDCGAVRHRDAAERELRKLGRAVHRRTRRGSADATGIATLSGRELEVAELVVDRRTNAEIAAALFLSTKTVETHLRNIFRKLDVDSRVEVARAVEREREAGRA